jgi:hypothetical protein
LLDFGRILSLISAQAREHVWMQSNTADTANWSLLDE